MSLKPKQISFMYEDPWDKNPYYSPAKNGLEIVAELDEPGLSYAYNQLIVFNDVKTNRLYFAKDSGCSCPTPFEGYYYEGDGKTNMEAITSSNLDSFIQEMNNFPDDETSRRAMEVAVRAHLKEYPTY